MKKLLLCAAAMTLLFTACKKDDDDNGSSQTFKIGTNSYTAITVAAAGSTNSLTAADAAANGLVIYFNALPTSGGSYTVVGNASPGANQIAVFATNNTGANTYWSTGNDNKTATVSVSGGKVSVSLPDVWAMKTGTTDSVQISANITQTN